jgi:ankyrin
MVFRLRRERCAARCGRRQALAFASDRRERLRYSRPGAQRRVALPLDLPEVSVWFIIVLDLLVQVNSPQPDLAMEASVIVQTARHHASGGDLDALVYVTPEGEESNGVTRLYHAAGNNWCAAVEWLVEQGANVHLGQPSDGFTPLQIAASQGHSDAAVLLLDAGARADDRDQHGQTALHFASAGNHPKMLKLLLQA